MRRWLLLLLGGCDGVLGLQRVPPVVAPSSQSIAAGDAHTCWIRGDGALFCWGSNDSRQLGLGTSVEEPPAISQVGSEKWIAVSANANSTCAIQADHSLWCWGDNFNGQLGVAAKYPDAPTRVEGTYHAISVDGSHSCGIDDHDALWCWGDNSRGEIGDGTTINAPMPVMVATGISAVTAGTEFTCAIAHDDSLYCWGRNDNGELGDGSLSDHALPAVVGSESWSQIRAGIFHTCGVTRDGRLRCWGGGFSGMLGTGTSNDEPAPTPVLVGGLDQTTWVGVASSGLHSCAWTKDQASCWGSSSRGELGVDGDANVGQPVTFPGGPWQAIVLGAHHACAADARRTLACIGSNAHGQLGVPGSSQLLPELVNSDRPWYRVYVGHHDTCAADGTGYAACGGENFNGELGLGDHLARQSLPPVDMQTTWRSLAVGNTHVCGPDGVNEYGWCWGDNDTGQLGTGTNTSVATRTMPAFASSQLQISRFAAGAHTCAITASGALYCWGANEAGQLGNGAPSPTPTRSPSPIGAPAGATSWWDVAVGDSFTCAIDNANITGGGRLWCWGRNAEGQLGTGDNLDQAWPTAVASSSMSFTRVVASRYHVCAIEVTKGLWCWGENGDAQVGNGTSTNVNTPFQIVGNWADVALGAYHTCGLSDPDLHRACWGGNGRGQLGNGDAMRQTVTTPVFTDPDAWDTIAAGGYHTCGIRNFGLYCWGANDDGELVDGKAWTTTLVVVPTP